MNDIYYVEVYDKDVVVDKDALEKANKELKEKRFIGIEKIEVLSNGEIDVVFDENEGAFQSIYEEDVEELAKILKKVIKKGTLDFYFHYQGPRGGFHDPGDWGLRIKDGKAYIIEGEKKWKEDKEI